MATPMMVQYSEIKQQYKDSILFFRLGDFYEMFEQDAKEASRILDLTLTKRNGVPMCGIPYHAAGTYIAKLLKAQKKIAICEQTFIPRQGKGIAKREVVEVITPGTIIDEDLLEGSENNYLLSIGKIDEYISYAYIDLSTAEFVAGSFLLTECEEKLKAEFHRISPKEIIIQESLIEENICIKKILYEQVGIIINRYPDWSFNYESNRKLLEKQLGVANLKGFGFSEDSKEIPAAGVIIDYVSETSKSLLVHIKTISLHIERKWVGLDESTRRNLEILRNLQDGSKKYTLLSILDYTKTSMGSRRLKKWIGHPLLDINEIIKRQHITDFLYRNQILLSSLRDFLSKILDIERLSSKIAMDKANAKDLLGIKSSLGRVVDIIELGKTYPELTGYGKRCKEEVSSLKELTDFLEKALLEEPSLFINQGNLIKEGFNGELDSLRKIKDNNREVLQRLLEKERKKTGIQSLKLKYNRIIGYFFEVTKTHLKLIPSYFIRRQSLVSAERFSTEELIEKETQINSASEKIIDLEKELFIGIREKVKKMVSLLLNSAEFISILDVLQSFAFSSTVNGFSKPELKDDTQLVIVNGRHPVVEANLPSGSFIPNSIKLDNKNGTFVLLTGPNMAGKSTFLRQIALITLMAQIGSFVPADEATIGIVDKIFCRVGATDNLARGESTFLVEMNETANILRSATEKSLLILDEVGRGTSTNDGLSIAWAVSEYILKKIKAKTIFATHFHELTILIHSSLKNFSMDVIEQGGQIVFLKKIKAGPADNSYGIHVAKLAGLPDDVISRAEIILEKLIKEGNKIEHVVEETEEIDQFQMEQADLFSPHEMIMRELNSININCLTPLDALNIIAKWKKEFK